MNLLFDTVCPHGFVINGYSPNKLINEFKKHQNKVHIDLGKMDYIYQPNENDNCFMLYEDWRQIDGNKTYLYIIDLDNPSVKLNNISDGIIRFQENHMIKYRIINNSKRKLTEKEKETLLKIHTNIEE
tara:strand:+ start:2790 stop:3173 length:384 start_codon:yes stop_codon:yes gene_type:complete